MLGVMVGLATVPANAQATENVWRSWGGSPGIGGAVFAQVAWDPDGPGPLQAQLVVAGNFTTAGGLSVNRIARWAGSTWEPLGTGFQEVVTGLTTWDPDGPGPQFAQLVATGSFTNTGGVTVNRIARWDGSAWHPIGSGLSSGGSALTTWDPDGPGPLPAQLVVGGSFVTAGGVTVNRIARWDGSTWQAFGTGMQGSPGSVSALTTWDPDGSGPLFAQLVAGDSFTNASGVPVNRMFRWDGSAWQQIGSDFSGRISTVTTWDPDGSGPLPDELVAGGSFSTVGGVTVNSIARWDGSGWRAIGAGLRSTVAGITSFDPDGPGPLLAELVAAGGFTRTGDFTVDRIARWDGSGWRRLGFGLNGQVPNAHSVITWDPDGSGPLHDQVVVAGEFSLAGDLTVNRIARWNGSAWFPIGNALSSGVSALTTWDPDEAGPLPDQLVAAGSFVHGGGVRINNIGRWDGSAWQPFGTGLSGTFPIAHAVTTWDPDGSGPLPNQLVVGGNFTTAGGVTVNHLARWNGSAWQSFGGGLSSRTNWLTTWDPDGQGPLGAQLVVTGLFNANASGSVFLNRVARWDGANWQPFGLGVDGEGWAMTTWDPDGTGPLPDQLVVGGDFVTASGITVNYIALWDGSAWQPLGTGMGRAGNSGRVRSLITWDPDGTGPAPTHLVAGGDFTSAGGVEALFVARWDGSAWHPLGAGTNGSVYDLTTWDPDGEGPLPAQLVAGGIFSQAGGVTVNGIARWDGSAWHPFATGMGGGLRRASAVISWDPDRSGPRTPQLLVGGEFASAGGVPAANLAMWGCCIDRSNGSCDSPDFNNDGVFPDTEDLADYFRVLAGGDCPTCNDLDFNNDGVFPDDEDLAAYLRVLGGGSC